MSPAARPSVPSSSVIPVPSNALSALNQGRQPQPFESVARLSAVITQAALSTGNSPTSASAEYVIRRLLLGVSVSSGAVRINYAYILSALIGELTANSNRRAMDEIFDAVRKMYGPGGSFEMGYAGAERERALGTLASLAAIVKGYSGRACSASTFREIISMLRSVVDAEAAKWRLRWAALRIVETLLSYVKQEDSDALVKPMWRWCEDRREKEDGLQMALLLHRDGVIGTKVFAKLYPSLEDGFQTALLDTFETGFPIVGETLFRMDGKGEDIEYVVPYAWLMAVKYVLSEEGAKHTCDISEFWSNVVVKKLLQGSRSGEKKLLALELIPFLVDSIDDVETFDVIFDDTLADTIATVLNDRRRKNRSVELSKGKTSAIVMTRLVASAKQLGQVVVTSACSGSETTKDRSPLLRAVLLWTVRGGLLHHLFPAESLAKCMQGLSRDCVISLFSEAVRQYVQPRNDFQESTKFAKLCNSLQRPNILLFLFTLARQYSFLAKDVVRIVIWYSFFEDAEKTVKNDCALEFDVYKSHVSDTNGGILPLPFPALSTAVAATGFRYLIGFLTESWNEGLVDSLSVFSMDVTRSLLSSESCSLRARNPAFVSRIVMNDNKETTLPAVAAKVADRLAEGPITNENAPLIQTLKTIVAFMYLYLFEPARVHTESLDTDGIASYYISFLEKLVSCSDALCGKKSGKEPTFADDDDLIIEPIEQVTHFIAELCGRDSTTFQRIALLSIEVLGSVSDDKVVAVLFDSMESYLQGDEEADADGDRTAARDSDSDSDENSEDIDEESEVEDEGSSGRDSDRGKGNSDDNGNEIAGSQVNPGESTEEKDGTMGPEKDEDGTNQDSLEDDNGSDAGIDIDEEDPAVLAQFDKMLGAHMALMKKEKKAANRRKLREDLRCVKVSRVLDVVEALARVLRIRLEKWKVEDPKLPLVFMDLHARLYEFAFDDEGNNIRFLKQIASIVGKQMLLPCSIFEGKISDVQTALGIGDRFFEVLRTCKADRKGFPVEVQAMSRSAGVFISIVESLSEEDYARSFPVYRDILEKMLQPGMCFWTPALFNSFIHTATEKAVDLLPILFQALQSENMTKNRRKVVSDVIVILSSATRSVQKSSNVASKFWATMQDLVRKECTGDNLDKKWHAQSLVALFQILVNGIKGGFVASDDQLISTITAHIKAFPMNKRDRARALKLLKLPKFYEDAYNSTTIQEERKPSSPSAPSSKRRKL